MSGLSDSDSDADSSDSEGLQNDGKAPEPDDLREYGRCIGIDVDADVDLQWVVQKAFSAELPPSWSEHSDDHGRVYFFNQVTQESSWSHPMDSVFREIVEVVKALRAEKPAATAVRRAEVLQAHLQLVQQRAMSQLEGWSGPYPSDAGQYYYHNSLNVSTWDNPVDEWQKELLIRQQVLQRCLLPDYAHYGTLLADGDGTSVMPRLPLGLAAPSADGPLPPTSPSSARSFATARSGVSARTPRGKSPRKHHSGRSAEESARLSQVEDSARSQDLEGFGNPISPRMGNSRRPSDGGPRELITTLPEVPEKDADSPLRQDEPLRLETTAISAADAVAGSALSPSESSTAKRAVRYPPVKTESPTVAEPLKRDKGVTPWCSGYEVPPSVPLSSGKVPSGTEAKSPTDVAASVRSRILLNGLEDDDDEEEFNEITFGKTNPLQGALEAELRAAAGASGLPQFGKSVGHG